MIITQGKGLVYCFSREQPKTAYRKARTEYYQRGQGWQDNKKLYDPTTARALKQHITQYEHVMVSQYKQELTLIKKLPLNNSDKDK